MGKDVFSSGFFFHFCCFLVLNEYSAMEKYIDATEGIFLV